MARYGSGEQATHERTVTQGGVEVWWAAPGDADAGLMRLLDDVELSRIEGLVRDADRRRYLVTHALARLAVATALEVPPDDVVFDRSCIRCGEPHGKPRVRRPDCALDLSLSHSGDRVAVAISAGGAVGVDVELVDRSLNPSELAPMILSAQETVELLRLAPHERPRGLLRYWTRKEAVLKATGHGLSVAPTTLTVSAPDQEPVLLLWPESEGTARPTQLVDVDPDEDHVACLALLSSQPVHVRTRDGAALLSP